MCFLALCMSSLEKYLFRFYAYYFIGFFFLLCCISCWYIFWEKFLIGHFICKYFLPSWGFLIFFFNGFLRCTKALKLIWSHLFVFVFIFITLSGGSKNNIFLWFTSECVLCMFCFKSFIVSSLTFRSLIHLSLFLYMMLESVLTSVFYM